MEILNLPNFGKTVENPKVKQRQIARIFPSEGTWKFRLVHPNFVAWKLVHTIRVVSAKGGKSWATVDCFGETCPICRDNGRATIKVGILVWDESDSKFCKSCGSENFMKSDKCFVCGSTSLEVRQAKNYKTLVLSNRQGQALKIALKTFITETEEITGKRPDLKDILCVMRVSGRGQQKTVAFSFFVKPDSDYEPMPVEEFDEERVLRQISLPFTADIVEKLYNKEIDMNQAWELYKAAREAEKGDNSTNDVKSVEEVAKNFVNSLFEEE